MKSTPKSDFSHLQQNVIERQLCCLCGACVASCPAEVLNFGDDGPELAGKCTKCGICANVCPGLDYPAQAVAERLFSSPPPLYRHPVLGCVREFAYLEAVDRGIKLNAWMGGKISGLLAYGLEQKAWDAAVVSRWGTPTSHPWRAEAEVIRDRAGVLATAKSKYTFSPNLLGLKTLAAAKDVSQAAFVGLPCHVRALRRMQLMGAPLKKLTHKIVLVIGLNCMGPIMFPDEYRRYFSRTFSLPMEQIQAIDTEQPKPGFMSFTAKTSQGTKTHTLNIGSFIMYTQRQGRKWPRCRVCTDYSAEFADLSCGRPVIRTLEGSRFVNQAIKAGYLKPAPLFIKEQQRIIDQFLGRNKKRSPFRPQVHQEL